MGEHGIAAQHLVLADESAVDPFVTGGLCRLPSEKLNEAIGALARVKAAYGVRSDAEIHCRRLFVADARAKTPFKNLSPQECVELIIASVKAINSLGGTWFGCWVDRGKYPRELQLVEGRPFRVETKHLAGLVVQSALFVLDDHVGSNYQLAFDPDPTKIDWGLTRMQQATHFARTHPQMVKLPISYQPLLELADIAAYTVGQKMLKPTNRKAKHFKSILQTMQMRTATLEYRPEERGMARVQGDAPQ